MAAYSKGKGAALRKKRNRGAQEAYRLLPCAILMLNRNSNTKSFQTLEFCYSRKQSYCINDFSQMYDVKVSLTFNKVEKTKIEIWILFIFFLFLPQE